jgi:O-succinylbenzoate synthase
MWARFVYAYSQSVPQIMGIILKDLEQYLKDLRVRLDATRAWLDEVKVKYGIV